MRNITPYMATNSRIMPAVPVLKAGFRKKRISSIGSLVCSSQKTNTVRTTTAMTKAMSVGALSQPLSGASMRP